MSEVNSNVRVRTNVVSFDNFLSDIARFQRGLSWEELHQYLHLFWVNRSDEVLGSLTPAQRVERDQFMDPGRRLPDPYLAVCDSHRFLLLPRTRNPEPVSTKQGGKDPGAEQPAVAVQVVTSVANPQERVILAALNSKQLVLAPPGTGKTHTVVQRLAHLASSDHLKGDLTPVLMVTFSRAAAAELNQRLALEITRRAGTIYQFPRISTLDSFTGQLLSQILTQRNDEGYDANIRHLARILEGLEGDSLQQRAAELIRQRIRLVVVDEVQDVVGVRARLVRNLFRVLQEVEHGTLLLGDLRQAIYGFALERSAADEKSLDPFWLIREVRGLYGDLEQISFLEQYRFSPSCQRLMTQLQAAMDDPTERFLPGEQPSPVLLREVLSGLPSLEDPLQLAGKDSGERRVAVLARSNDEVRRLEVACREVLSRPGRTVRVVARSEGRGYPGWVGRVFGAPDAPARYTAEGFLQAFAVRVGGERRVADECLDWLVTACSLQRNAFTAAEVIDTLRRNPDVPGDLREQPQPGEVWISTIHQAKGREFDCVVIADVARLLASAAADPESCRLAYVAATRARREVYRCAGSYWLPRVFDWSPAHFDANPTNPSPQPREPGQRAHEALWRAFRGTGRMVIRHRGDELFVLEPEAFDGACLTLSRDFSTAFLSHATGVLRATSPLSSEYSVQITDLRTHATGFDDDPVVLLPELSGKIERIG